MARCEVCRQEMTRARSCAEVEVSFTEKGKVVSMAAIPYYGAGRCSDCGVKPGGYHHVGCPREVCCRCFGLVASCDCPLATLDDLVA